MYSTVWRRKCPPTPVLLPGKCHGWRSLVGYSLWGCEESDTTEWLHFLFSLSCTGEGNGNPLQCSCLENPRDGRAWWAAIYGVAQSRTRLKWLSSSSIVIQYFYNYIPFNYYKMCVLLLQVVQSCLTLCDPTDFSPPGCSVHGILQARIL